jgi:hypothetical protein
VFHFDELDGKNLQTTSPNNIATRREEKLSTDRNELKYMPPFGPCNGQALPVTFSFFPNSLKEIMQSTELAALAKVKYEMSE